MILKAPRRTCYCHLPPLVLNDTKGQPIPGCCLGDLGSARPAGCNRQAPAGMCEVAVYPKSKLLSSLLYNVLLVARSFVLKLFFFTRCRMHKQVLSSGSRRRCVRPRLWPSLHVHFVDRVQSFWPNKTLIGLCLAVAGLCVAKIRQTRFSQEQDSWHLLAVSRFLREHPGILRLLLPLRSSFLTDNSLTLAFLLLLALGTSKVAFKGSSRVRSPT